MEDQDIQDPANSYYEEPLSTSKDFTPSPALENSGSREAGSIKIEHGVVYNLPLCNLHNRRVIEVKECYIVLYDHFLVYKIVGQYEALNNDTETWEEYKTNFRWTRMRKDIMDVSMSYDNAEKLWFVELEVGKNVQTWFWEKGADAKKFYDVLQNYFVTRDQKI